VGCGSVCLSNFSQFKTKTAETTFFLSSLHIFSVSEYLYPCVQRVSDTDTSPPLEYPCNIGCRRSRSRCCCFGVGAISICDGVDREEGGEVEARPGGAETTVATKYRFRPGHIWRIKTYTDSVLSTRVW
jgi:hypothetical protein